MKVLITGGAGFLGRHFTKWLLEHAHSVTIIDDLSTGLHPSDWMDKVAVQNSQIDRFKFIEGDMEDFLKDYEEDVDLAIHLAAVVGGRAVIEGKPAMGADSLRLDAMFFKWCAKAKPKHTIFMSSSAIYPLAFQSNEHNDIPLKEMTQDLSVNFPVLGLPDMVYGWSKLTGEFLAMTFAKHYGLNIFCPRPFSGYGEDQSSDYPMPAICERAINKEDPFEVWGSGDQVRDFIYVDDLIEGIMQVAPTIEGYDCMNYGTGYGTSFRELAKLAAKICGYEANVKPLTDKPEGVKCRVGNTDKMEQYFSPKTTLEEGISRVIAHIRKTKYS